MDNLNWKLYDLQKLNKSDKLFVGHASKKQKTVAHNWNKTCLLFHQIKYNKTVILHKMNLKDVVCYIFKVYLERRRKRKRNNEIFTTENWFKIFRKEWKFIFFNMIFKSFNSNILQKNSELSFLFVSILDSKFLKKKKKKIVSIKIFFLWMLSFVKGGD